MIGLLAVDLPEIPGAPVEVLVFALLALMAVAGAVTVVAASDPFISALALLLNFVSLGALYLFLHAPFVAIAQVIVYAGAVVVLFLFVIAYLGDRRELFGSARRARWLPPAGIGVGVGLLALLGGVVLLGNVSEIGGGPRKVGDDFGSVRAIGEQFLTKFLLEFEATSIVLLVAAIGGVVLGLTGRARGTRLREMMETESADQLKRRMRREARAAGTTPVATTPAGSSDEGRGGDTR